MMKGCLSKKVSVIIPVYNGKKAIKRCIDSILNQTYKNLEIIVIDDGSSDGSSEYLHALYPNGEMQMITKPNEGVAKTRNRGIQIATGEYLAFVDQDDYLLPTYFEEYMKKVEESGSEIVVGGYQRISDDGKVSRVEQLDDSEWAKMVVTAPWAHVYKTEFIKEHDIQFLSTGLGEDIYYNMLAYSYAKHVVTIPSISYMWVDNPVSVSNSKQNVVTEKRSPLLLLSELQKHLPKENMLGKDFEEYFFVRYIAWYFLFTFRGSKRSIFEVMYHKVMEWLREHYPDYRKNPYMSLGKPKGDPFFIRLSVWVFYGLERIGLLLPVLNLFTVNDKGE